MRWWPHERGRRRMDRIVVGVDGSEQSRRALRWAFDEAERRQARLDVVCAWDAPFGPTWGTLGTDVAAYETAALRLLEQEVTKMPSGTASITVDQHALRGSAGSVLVGLSREADLIVVGSRGRGGFAGLRLGSVSAQVAHHADCPVVIVHQREAPS